VAFIVRDLRVTRGDPHETAAWLGWRAARGPRNVVGPAADTEVDALIDAHAELVWHTLYADAPARGHRAVNV
jgi:hypothetical protein